MRQSAWALKKLAEQTDARVLVEEQLAQALEHNKQMHTRQAKIRFEQMLALQRASDESQARRKVQYPTDNVLISPSIHVFALLRIVGREGLPSGNESLYERTSCTEKACRV